MSASHSEPMGARNWEPDFQKQANNMKTKHTPGKWHVEKHQRFMPYESGGPGGSFEGVNTRFNLIVHEDPNDPRLRTPIAEMTVSTEADANARMIAAAPELLEACKAVLRWAKTPGDHGGNPYCHEFVKMAEAAIAKAEPVKAGPVIHRDPDGKGFTAIL